MKMRGLAMSVSFVAVLGFSFFALAAAPGFVPIQGYLTDADGAPVDGAVTLRLMLWDSSIGGQAVFQEQIDVLVEQGYFSLYLGGAGNPALDLATFREHGALFLGFAVDGGAELQPRLPIGSVPYAGFAQYAGDAATLGGRPVADFRLGADQVSWDDLTGVPDVLLDGDADSLAGLTCAAGQVAKWDGAAWACADDVDTDTDTQLTEAEVDAMVADNGYVHTDALAPVATSGDYNDLLNLPADADTLAGLTCADGQLPAWDDANAVWECVDDLDTDTLATLACLDGQVAKWDGLAGAWACADDVDTDTNTQLTEAEVDAFVADNGYAMDGHDHDAAYVNEGQVGSVSSAMIMDNTVQGLDVMDGTLTLADISTASFDSRYALASHNHDASYAAIGHDHDAAYVNEGQADSITSAMIALDTITAADIATGAVGSAEIANNSVQALDIADEPGLEYGSSFTNLDPTNAWQTAATINISWPAAGFLVTIAEFQVSCSAESNVQARIELVGLGLTSPLWVRTVPVVGNYAIMNTQFVASVGSSGSSDVNLGILTLPDNCNYFRVLSLATMYFPTRY